MRVNKIKTLNSAPGRRGRQVVKYDSGTLATPALLLSLAWTAKELYKNNKEIK